MPASASDDDRHIVCDLIGWQHRAQTEPLGTLGGRVAGELNHLADTLDELNQLLRVSIPWNRGHLRLVDLCNFPPLLTIERQFTFVALAFAGARAQ